MTCWPCIKEIINNGFAAAIETRHKQAQYLEQAVANGQIDKSEADLWLQEVSEEETDWLARVNKSSLDLAHRMKAKWDVPQKAPES